jgi:Ca-activated chloride channel family protein
VKRAYALASALALVAGSALGAAADRQRVAVFGVDLDVVKVTVSVEDKAGRNVRDLTREDFVIRENGRVQHPQVFARAFDAGHDENLALDLAVLFDTSESMLDVLKLSQRAATRFLEGIPRARDLLVVFFDQDIRISRYQSEQQQGLFNQIHTLESGGNTALRDAIAACLSRLASGQGRHAMVLFTDGDDTFSRIGYGELMRLVRSSAVTVYPVLISGETRGKDAARMARAFVGSLADVTGGRVFAPKSTARLSEVYQTILEDLEGQYVIGYVSANSSRDGKFRKLKIKVKRKGLKVRHRQGYYAPK